MAAAHLAAQWVTGVKATEQRCPHHTAIGLLAATSESWHCLRCFFFISTPRIKRVPGYFVAQMLAIYY
jgi:ribosomal protein S27AE